MKRVILPSLILLISALFVHPVAAQDFSIAVEPRGQEVLLRDDAFYTLKIKNDHTFTQKYSFWVEGPHLEWYSLGALLLEAGPGEEIETKLTFFPFSEHFGTHEFTVVVEPLIFPETRKRETFTLRVNDLFRFNSMTSTFEGQTATIASELEVRRPRAETLTITLRDPDGSVVETFTEEVVFDRFEFTKNQQFSHTFSVYASPGLYTVEAVIDGTELVATDLFTIPVVHNLIQESNTVSTAGSDTWTLNLRNEGNVEETYRLERDFGPFDVITGKITEPECTGTISGRKCIYEVTLQPGESGAISFGFEKWPTYVQILLSMVIIGVIVTTTISRRVKPTVRKRHVKKRHKSHSVAIEIKNGISQLNNVVVRDWITPLAEVIPEFETVEPIVRKSDAGTELVWRIGDMKPRETRILCYRIRPLVQADLKMPKVTVRYSDKSGKKLRFHSEPLEMS